MNPVPPDDSALGMSPSGAPEDILETIGARGMTDASPDPTGPEGERKRGQEEASIGASTQPQKRKKSWKKPVGMPKRPLSAYNLFFRHTRMTLLGEDVAKAYEISDQTKRKHRKTHGKIGFADMARRIGDMWKKADPETRRSFEEQAERERQRYKMEMAEWKKSQARESEEDIVRKVSLEKDSPPDKDVIPPHGPVKQSPRTQEAANFLAGFAGAGNTGVSIRGGRTTAFRPNYPIGVGAGAMAMRPTGALPGWTGNIGPMPPFGAGFDSGMPAAAGGAFGFPTTSLPQTAALPETARLRRLEELYRLHLAEAASLRQELGRHISPSPAPQLMGSPQMASITDQSALSEFGYGPSPSVAEDSLSLEQARADLAALERAAEARRAELAALTRARDVSPTQQDMYALERARQIEEELRRRRHSS